MNNDGHGLIRINIILLAIAMLVLTFRSATAQNKQQEKINNLETQIIELQEENKFLKEHYEEEIVMLDSQLLTLEAELVEMKDGVELIKK